jgi:uncharacterized protein (DUF305 family)
MTLKKIITCGSLTLAGLLLSACSKTSQPIQFHPFPTPSPTTHMDQAQHHQMSLPATDIEFIQQMIPHHQEAIDTSKEIIASTSNSKLKNFAVEVITTQQKEINQLKNWYQEWHGSAYVDDGQYQPMMPNLDTKTLQAKDQAYMEGMIAHHRGAVSMAEAMQGKAEHPEIQKMAEDIIRVQSLEITQLQMWLDELTQIKLLSPNPQR